MERLTEKCGEGYCLKAGAEAEVATRLAAYENIREELTARQAVLSAEIDRALLAGRQKHYKTKELLAEKLTNGSILSYLDRKGL